MSEFWHIVSIRSNISITVLTYWSIKTNTIGNKMWQYTYSFRFSLKNVYPLIRNVEIYICPQGHCNCYRFPSAGGSAYGASSPISFFSACKHFQKHEKFNQETHYQDFNYFHFLSLTPITLNTSRTLNGL